MSKVLLIGGTGTISSETATALARDRHKVAVFNRSVMGDVQSGYRGDRNNSNDLARALREFLPDVVIDFCCYSTEQLQSITTALPRSVAQYIFVSTCDVLGYPLAKVPIPEDGPFVPTVSAYAAKKLACEVLLREWAGSSPIAATIVRPTYTLGEKNLISLLDRSAVDLVHRLSNELDVVLPGDGTGIIHPSDCSDTGRMIATMAGDVNAFGESFTAGSADAWMTHLEYLEMIASAVGRPARFVEVAPEFLLHDERVPRDNLYREVTGFDLAFDFAKFNRAFPSFQWKTNVSARIASYVKRVLTLPAPAANESVEQRVLEAWLSR